MLLQVLSVVFPVFSIIGLGFVFAGFKKISLGPIIEVLLYLTVPALVISSLSERTLPVRDLGVVSLSALVVVLGTGAISYIFLSAIKRKEMKGMYLATMFMNSGNMGFPLALLAFGGEGLTVAVLYYVAISVLVYTLGIYMAKGRGGFSEVLKLPLIYAAVFAVAISLLGVELPEALSSTFGLLGAATIPLFQISLGYRLRSVKLSQPALSFAASLIRIGGGVLIAYTIVTLLGIGGVAGKVIILSSSMPSAVITFIVSHRYNLDSEFVASVVGASTVMSVFTTPLVLLWIM